MCWLERATITRKIEEQNKDIVAEVWSQGSCKVIYHLVICQRRYLLDPGKGDDENVQECGVLQRASLAVGPISTLGERQETGRRGDGEMNRRTCSREYCGVVVVVVETVENKFHGCRM